MPLRPFLNIFSHLIAVLLVFQGSIAYALPESIHLNVCFSSDGRINLTPDLCHTDPSKQQIGRPDLFISLNESHVDCLDLEIGCLSGGELRPTSSVKCPLKARIKKSTRAGLAASPDFLSASRILPPSTQTQTARTNQIFPSSLLSFLRTIVLLI